MLSSTSNTMHCLSIELGKPLPLSSMGFITLKAMRILPTSSASIGDTGRSGSYSNLCSFGGETPRTLMCLIFARHILVLLQIFNKRGVTRITQEWPTTLCALLVLFSSFRNHDQNKGINMIRIKELFHWLYSSAGPKIQDQIPTMTDHTYTSQTHHDIIHQV